MAPHPGPEPHRLVPALAKSAWAAFLLQLFLLQMQMACGLGCASMSPWVSAVFPRAFLSAAVQQRTVVLARTWHSLLCLCCEHVLWGVGCSGLWLAGG